MQRIIVIGCPGAGKSTCMLQIYALLEKYLKAWTIPEES